MNIRGYLKWQFEGTWRSMSFYAFVIILVAVAALFGGCPMPWPAVIMLTGLSLLTWDTARSWFRFSYRLYELERDSIQRELQRQEKS